MQRGEKGRYMREENTDKECKVLLENGEEKKMKKGQMYKLIKDNKEKRLFFKMDFILWYIKIFIRR